MAEDNFTLTTFYTSWKAFQDEIKRAIAPLTAEQLALRATPDLRSIGENVLHIVGCRAFWFAEFLGEDGGEHSSRALPSWPRDSTAPGTSWRIACHAGVPTRCDRPSPTTGTANALTCRALGSSGMSWSTTCSTAASCRSSWACTLSRRGSPASGGRALIGRGGIMRQVTQTQTVDYQGAPSRSPWWGCFTVTIIHRPWAQTLLL